MARVRRPGAVLPLAKHQAVGSKYVVEAVPANLELITEVFLAQGQQLAAATLRQAILRSQPAAVHHDARHEYTELFITLLMLVIAVTANAKQFTESRLGVMATRAVLL